MVLGIQICLGINFYKNVLRHGAGHPNRFVLLNLDRIQGFLEKPMSTSRLMVLPTKEPKVRLHGRRLRSPK